MPTTTINRHRCTHDRDASLQVVDDPRFLDRVVRSLRDRPALELRDESCFPEGPGAYLLRYCGAHSLYTQLGNRPIYVGSARGLEERRRRHVTTLGMVDSLDADDFDVVLLPTLRRGTALVIEEVLIEALDPVWNRFTGFGSRDPGRTRLGKASDWDHLHPGRPWVRSLDRDPAQLARLVAEHVDRTCLAVPLREPASPRRSRCQPMSTGDGSRRCTPSAAASSATA